MLPRKESDDTIARCLRTSERTAELMKPDVASPIAPMVAMTTFTADQWEKLGRLRDRCPHGAEHFSAQELARLRFMRWLYHEGRLCE